MNTLKYTDIAKNIVRQTQKDILDSFNNKIHVHIKSDHTPDTIADKNAEKIIRKPTPTFRGSTAFKKKTATWSYPRSRGVRKPSMDSRNGL